jgi:hypothetical protein
VLLRLLNTCQLETRWIGAGVRCVPIRDGGWGTLGKVYEAWAMKPGLGSLGWEAWAGKPGLGSLGWETMVKVYGVAMVRPQGYSRVPNPSTGQQ